MKSFLKKIYFLPAKINGSPYIYKKTPYLFHHTLQSLYELCSPNIVVDYQRQKIFFPDGGHIALDWVNKSKCLKIQDYETPIIFVTHGMTGGSNKKYMKAIAKQAENRGLTCVCMNNRGFNSQMTSPVPFIGLQFEELEAALRRVKTRFPKRPLVMLGMSLGGNYLLRYLTSSNKSTELLENLQAFIAVCPPFDLKDAVHNMNPSYQKLFLLSYIRSLVEGHQQMAYWWQSGLVDLKHLKQSRNLKQFHERITQKIVGISADDFLERFKVNGDQLNQLSTDTLLIFSRDDPMIDFETVPLANIKQNNLVKLVITESGAHMCWFEGLVPSRWYPRAVFSFIEQTMTKALKKLR